MITQRMLPAAKAVTTASKKVIWGAAEDGALNDGTRASIDIYNTLSRDLTVTILVKPTIDSAFVANTATVTAAKNSVHTRIDLTDMEGYAIQLQGQLQGGGSVSGVVTVSAQVTR